MAITYYPEVIATAGWTWGLSNGATIAAETLQHKYPYPSLGGSVGSTYINKVWNTAANEWVLWFTDFEDVDGIFYPGPGIFGVSTSDYRVEAITFSEQ